MTNRIYLDNAATTPPCSESVAAMAPFLGGLHWGNASSMHQEGQRAKRSLDSAREIVATSLSAEFSEIVFTSGGTEADNLAVIGAALAAGPERRRVVVSAIEHEAVLRSADFLHSIGFEIILCPVDSSGIVQVEALRNVVDSRTAVVSIMHANNEVGTVQNITHLATVAHACGAVFHSDAVQSFGSLPINVHQMGVDLLSVSSHKIYGPKGAGALYIRTDTPIVPTMHGGSQERERRGGTENTAAIAGFAAAAQIAESRRVEEYSRLTRLRDKFLNDLVAEIDDVTINGHRKLRLPNNIHFSVKGLNAEAFLVALDLAGISASSGSACSSGSREPSHVLKAMSNSEVEPGAPIRFSLGRSTTHFELDCVLREVSRIVSHQRPSQKVKQ